MLLCRTAESVERLLHRHTLQDGVPALIVHVLALLRRVQYLAQFVDRHDDDAVQVCQHEIAGVDGHWRPVGCC